MEKQPELFGEFREPGIKKNVFGGAAFPEKAFVFSFSKERLILLFIAFIIVLAIMFAIGFEKGRKSASYKNAAGPAGGLTARQTRIVNINPELPRSVMPKPYTVQVATYRSRESAQKEGTKIKGKGFPVVIIGINGVYQILVGEYSTERDAQQALNTLKKMYSGSYIRKR